MCISIPARVVQVGDTIAIVDFGNGEPTLPLINANEEVGEGDYVVEVMEKSYRKLVKKNT